MWVRGFRDHTTSGREFNLFKPLRLHFRATPFCRQAHSRRDRGGLLREGGTEQLRNAGKKFVERPGSYATFPNPSPFSSYSKRSFGGYCVISSDYKALQQKIERRHASDDFSSTSSDFNALGASFCPSLNPGSFYEVLVMIVAKLNQLRRHQIDISCVFEF